MAYISNLLEISHPHSHPTMPWCALLVFACKWTVCCLSKDYSYKSVLWQGRGRGYTVHPCPVRVIVRMADDGNSRIEWLLSYEYQRMWLEEREAWKKRMYPENNTVNVDVVKRYVLTFKTNHQPPKPEKKKPFRMKKFEGIPSKTKNVRAPDDKAMNFEKKGK